MNNVKNNAVMITTLEPFPHVEFLKGDLQFANTPEDMEIILRRLGEDNSILIVLKDGRNIEIEQDPNDHQLIVKIDNISYEIESNGNKLIEVNNTEKEEAMENENLTLTAANVEEYVIEHLSEVSAGGDWVLDEIKELRDNGSYGDSDVLFNNPFIGKLDTSETVEVREGEDSILHDGAEISVVIRIDDRYFIDYGTYNSWDASYFNKNYVEVERVEVPVIRIEYRPIS